MQIAICDDEQKELKVIRTALDTYREAHPEYSFDIDEYSTVLDVLHAAAIICSLTVSVSGRYRKEVRIYYSKYLQRKLC